MTMQTGDKVTIRRGKMAGTEGTVKLTNTDTVVLELTNGDLITQKITNIKVPDEATITQGELAAIIGSDVSDGLISVGTLVHALDSKYPGFARHFPNLQTAEPADPRDITGY